MDGRSGQRKRHVLCMLLVIVTMAGITGCAIRPMVTIPEGMTVDTLYDMIRRQSESIADFTGTALIKSGDDVSAKSVSVSIRFKAPARLRVVAKAFAGIPLGLIAADGDSATMFFPADNTYITLGRRDTALTRLIGGYGIEIDHPVTALTGFPDMDGGTDIQKTLERDGKRMVLTLFDGETTFRLSLEGDDYRIVETTVERFGTVAVKRRASRFKTVGGIPLPGRVVVTTGRGTFDIAFSDLSVNNGLTDSEVSFTVPPGAGCLSLRELLERM